MCDEVKNGNINLNMRITLFLIAFITGIFSLSGQTNTSVNDTIKVKLMVGSDTLSGATLLVKGSNPQIGTTSDYEGVAVMIIPKDKDLIEIKTYVGPFIQLQIIRPVDYIYFDIRSKYATYYYKDKKMKRKKQIVIPSVKKM
jgi:hypothetical protein